MDQQMSLAELADASGLAARTIRFYIARGLVDGPLKAGRGAVYTRDHLERLERIKSLQEKGHMLSDIARTLDGAEPKPAAMEAAPWWQHVIAEDVTVWTRADAGPWRTKQIRAALEVFARALDQGGKGRRKD